MCIMAGDVRCNLEKQLQQRTKAHDGQLQYNMAYRIKDAQHILANPGQRLKNHKKGCGKQPQPSGNTSSCSESEDIFEPEFHTMKKLRIPINRKISKGAWTLQENKIYFNFLVSNKSSFISEAERRESRVFCRLSEVLRKKRTPDQCRSHHQKLVGKEQQSVESIIDRLRLKIQESEQASNWQRKTRIIGKFKLAKLRKLEESRQKQQEGAIKLENEEDQCQILKVEQKSFYNITTFKNSPRIQLQINEEAIRSYIPR